MCPEQLPIWTIYDHPRDFPDHYVARLWLGEAPTNKVIVNDDLDRLRDQLALRGLARMSRHAGDDPRIVETWF